MKRKEERNIVQPWSNAAMRGWDKKMCKYEIGEGVKMDLA